MLRIFLAFALLTWAFSACKSPEADTQAPVLEVLSFSQNFENQELCGQMESVLPLLSEDTLRVRLRFSDNEALSQYKIDLHSNFDCHGHRTLPSGAWSILELGDLEGEQVEREFALVAPANARAGAYHLQFWVLDEAGNEPTQLYFYSLVLRNRADTIPPVLQWPNHNAGDTLQVTKGQNETITLDLSDNQNLAGGRIELVYWTASGNRAVLAVEDFTQNQSNLSSNLNFTVANSLPSGLYPARLSLYDAYYNRVDFNFYLSF